ncbi:MAG: alanine--tRNA ligase [Vicinamibacterales bacterium]
MHSREIREGFLAFFERHGHRVVPSASLVPVDDPTLLFTNAGMNQFKDLFLGKETREYRRAASSQKCMRVSGKHNDLDNVGPSLRHHTFFEMLGNFSFGDYFKADAIEFAWRVLTSVWHLSPERLHATVFRGESGVPRDSEAVDLWTRFLPASRISELGAADNFWQMGDTGPCGRCSEIHFHRPELPCPHRVCRGIECNCDRYVEIWNNVFMEFERQPGGHLEPLPAPSIDTGMGLERITAVIQNKLSNYDTDLFQPLLAVIGDLTGHEYGNDSASDISMRVIADHGRAMTFLIADGVVPSNEWRGYVLRKIMRRAMRHGKKLGAREPFLHRLVDVIGAEMGAAYREIPQQQERIAQAIRAEEDRFDAVLTAGLPKLEDLLERAAAGSRVIRGEDMFRLYDSLGLPVDFIEDLASERALGVDRAGFDRAMEAQRDRARAASAFETRRTQEFIFSAPDVQARVAATPDRFVGYTTTEVLDAAVLALFDGERKQVESLTEGQSGFVVLDRTPFYVESGGQVSDTGEIAAVGARAVVEGMTRLNPGGLRAHRVQVTVGQLREGLSVTARVDAERRAAIRRNHTATHLLHAALRQVLGPHVKQAGSLVAPDRLRFDFQHTAPISIHDLERIEQIVNEQVYRNSGVTTTVMRTEEAISQGAMALFGEKYGDQVRVVVVPDFSKELCGGTHCVATGDIGPFSVLSEAGVAAGVRRVEAVTGAHAVALSQRRHATLHAVLAALNASADDAPHTVERLQQEVKKLAKENSELKVKIALAGPERGGGAAPETAEVAGVKVLTRRVQNLDKAGLRTLSDSLRDSLGSGVVVLASEQDGKVALVVSVTRDLTSRVKAGNLVKHLAPLIGGGGGGRPDFAEAGGKDAAGIDAMLAKAPESVAAELAGA